MLRFQDSLSGFEHSLLHFILRQRRVSRELHIIHDPPAPLFSSTFEFQAIERPARTANSHRTHGHRTQRALEAHPSDLSLEALHASIRNCCRSPEQFCTVTVLSSPCQSATQSYPINMVSSSRPRTPSAGNSSPPDKLAAIPESKSHPPRRSSLGLLLRRTKSGDLGNRGSKKQQALAREQEAERLRREAPAIPKSPPRLPDLYNGVAPPQLQTFGGEDRPDSVAIMSGRFHQGPARGSMDPPRAVTANLPIPPIPSSGARNGDWVDPYARTESMTHRGRYSYASSAVSTINSPRRVRRRKDPTPFK